MGYLTLINGNTNHSVCNVVSFEPCSCPSFSLFLLSSSLPPLPLLPPSPLPLLLPPLSPSSPLAPTTTLRRTLDYQEVLDALAQKGISIRVASPKLVMEEVHH